MVFRSSEKLSLDNVLCFDFPAGVSPKGSFPSFLLEWKVHCHWPLTGLFYGCGDAGGVRGGGSAEGGSQALQAWVPAGREEM